MKCLQFWTMADAFNIAALFIETQNYVNKIEAYLVDDTKSLNVLVNMTCLTIKNCVFDATLVDSIRDCRQKQIL